METWHIHDEAAMVRRAESFAGTLIPHPEHATVLALSGGLGGGKTTFVRAIARFFGVQESVTSPTFVLMKSYDLPSAAVGFERLVHVDAYRIENSEELSRLRWDEVLAAPANLVCIEWPEKVAPLVPDYAYRFTFTEGDGPERFIAYHDEG